MTTELLIRTQTSKINTTRELTRIIKSKKLLPLNQSVSFIESQVGHTHTKYGTLSLLAFRVQDSDL